MKVSIIIPVYNVRSYIKRCLESVANQSYSDIECILVDDCGKDDSMEIASLFIDNYNGPVEFVIIHHLENKGLSSARNTGIKSSNGDYVFFLDSDDAITSYCIELLVSLANKYPTADFVPGNTTQKEDCVPNYFFASHVPEFVDNKQLLYQVIFTKANMSAWNRLVKRSILIDHSLYFQEGIVHEDDCWVYFLAKYAKAAAFTNKGTYLYYMNSNSIMTSCSKTSLHKRLDSCYVIADIIIDDLTKTHASNLFQRIHLAGILVNILKLLSHFSICYWLHFWKYIFSKAIYLRKKFSLYRFLFLIAMLPPMCFFLKWKAWYWRLNQYVVSRV
jgi:Glycosyltransferases involved in cell wall biogenesis